MKKAFFAFLAVGTLALQAPVFANAECVPSKTVEQAKADYDAGFARISMKLTQTYAHAATHYDHMNAAALNSYKNRLLTVQAQYEKEAKEIRAELNLGWREALTAAAEKYNLGLRTASNDYTSATQKNLAEYNQTTVQAQAEYNSSAVQLTAEYNTSVCAKAE